LKEKELLHTVQALTKRGMFVLTSHAVTRRVERGMSLQDVEDILLNPIKILRLDELENGKTKYKIVGGSKQRKLAVLIEDLCVVVLTVM